MSTHNIHFLKEDNISKKDLNVCFLELSEDTPSKRFKNEFELAIVNEPPVFESLKFHCTLIRVLQSGSFKEYANSKIKEGRQQSRNTAP